MTPEEVEVNAEVLVVAGSETTATALSGATYWLTKTPHVLKKLADEVRSSFKDESEINLLNAAQLRYLNAVLKETLRIYPPAAVAMPRITPPKGSIVHGHAIPGNVWHNPPTYCSTLLEEPDVLLLMPPFSLDYHRHSSLGNVS